MIDGEEVPEELLSYQQRLVRKGYIDMKGAVMPAGMALYHSLFKEVEEIKVKKREKKPLEKFDEWWDVFPTSDNFVVNGRMFPGVRKLTTDKEGCRKIFNALTVNEFTVEDVIRATKYHINMAKQKSYSERANKLTYIPNSLRYLREKYFQPYIKPSENDNVEEKPGFEI